MDILLKELSTKKHFIEYDIFLSNHLSHGLVALHRLGATTDRLQRFVDWYKPRLEAPEPEAEDSRDFADLKGQRVGYYKILHHYQETLEREYNNDIDRFLAAEYPKISDGLAGSALHGSIHMGYGYSLKNPMLVLEGLSYVYHSHRPIVLSENSSDTFGTGDQNILDVLSRLAGDTKLREAMLAGANEERWLALKVGKFQIRVAYLLTVQADALKAYVDLIKLPDDCRRDDGTIDSLALMRNIITWAITAYAMSTAKNDFFLLHGVTCAWAIFQVLPLFSSADSLKVVKEYLIVLLAVYVTQNAPALTGPVPSDKDTSPAGWEELVCRCLSEDRDEHCFKLVQVCREMTQQCPQLANTCMHAANITLENEFIYTK